MRTIHSLDVSVSSLSAQAVTAAALDIFVDFWCAAAHVSSLTQLRPNRGKLWEVSMEVVSVTGNYLALSRKFELSSGDSRLAHALDDELRDEDAQHAERRNERRVMPKLCQKHGCWISSC